MTTLRGHPTVFGEASATDSRAIGARQREPARTAAPPCAPSSRAQRRNIAVGPAGVCACELHRAQVMYGSSWMLGQLDYATRAHHIPADAPRIALLGITASRCRYIDYLGRVYAFEAPIEARWAQTPGLDRVIDLDPRVRTPFLVTDLAALGQTPEALHLPCFVGVEQALGWMYVVERGRRMNGLLHRHLARRLPDVVALAGNYLNASSPRGARWQRLGATLDAVAHNQLIADQIINAAQRAFRVMRATPLPSGDKAASLGGTSDSATSRPVISSERRP